MRIFDFIVQSIFLAAALFSIALGKEWFIWLALVQFFIGIWQLISAIVNSFHRTTAFRKQMMLIYWCAVLFYVVGLGLISIFNTEMILGAWFFSAWFIAIFYYIYTLRLAFVKEDEKRTFLDVANE
jgi:hypothetical protein